jgi:hypothetical protein
MSKNDEALFNTLTKFSRDCRKLEKLNSNARRKNKKEQQRTHEGAN